MTELTDRLRDTAYETEICWEAAGVLDAIDILHQPWPNQRQCVECGLPWPCKTNRLVTGKEL